MNNNQLSFKLGFTLAELLVTMSVIGIIAMLTMPTIKQAMPDECDALIKKAEYELEQKITELVNDETLYGDTMKEGKLVRGLSNTYPVTVDNVTQAGPSSLTSTASGDNKFCKLLASKFNIAAGTSVNCANNRGPSFKTADGLEWNIPISNFDNSSIMQRRLTIPTILIKCPKTNDIFKYYITPSGKFYKDDYSERTDKIKIRK